MTQQTPMEDLLSRRNVDERERSPDDNPEGSIAESSEPEAFEQTEALTTQATEAKQPKVDKTAPTATEPKGEDEGGDSEGRRMSGLPKWAYLRIQANNEKATAAEKRAAEAERRIAQLEAQSRQRPQQGEEDQEETVASFIQKEIGKVKSEADERDYGRRFEFGKRLAVKDHGQETVEQALQWASDRVAAGDQQLNAGAYAANDPVEFAVQAFRRAQFEAEAGRYGYDIDKMLKARMAEQPQPQPATTPAQREVQSTNPEPRLPGDFTSAPNSAGRVNGDAGVTPLGELLQLGGRRR